jgi:mono/diheme cytochrome c family protein
VEVLGIVRYLLDRSQPVELRAPDADLDPSTPQEMAERGKVLFETRGCLACHKHADFPHAQADFGPDLSNIGDKFSLADGPDGQAWLFNWLKDPTLYHPRTRMPDTKLEPIEQADGTRTDPAADIAAYLMSSRSEWQPVEGTPEALELLGDEPWQSPESLQTALKDVAFQHLRKAFIEQDARSYLESGIPESLAARLPGPERELAGEISTEKLLRYVGQKAISKYGCYGCHDVPGFEDAKPIGTALADWGRKEPAKLAFDHVAQYLEHGHGGESSSLAADPFAQVEATDAAYFERAIGEHDRTGFLWQKLREPRSYDYEKYGADPTTYNDRLRMPQFSFSPQEREAVMTFVLGLVASPPAEKFVYQPDDRQQALIAGSQVLDKFNCGGCHILDAESWTLEFLPDDFGPQPINPAAEYPFLQSHFPSDEVAASAQPDPVTGRLTAVIRGMPALDGETGQPVMFDDFGDPIESGMQYDPSTVEHLFHIWDAALLGGNVYEPGILPLQIPARMIRSIRPAVGGDLTRWLVPRVIELEKQVNPQAQGTEALGWLPPQLTGQGRKVQPDWLHSFLLDPYPIRPAVFLRMPKFNMSSDDASKLVDYFAARDQAQYPYQFDDRNRSSHLAQAQAAYEAELAEVPQEQQPPGESRFDHAMNIVVDGNYCIKCHLVGDFEPAGSDRAKGPNLADVYRRLQPDFVREWIAKPTRVLSYTPMPVNIPYNATDEHLGGVSQQLYHGTSVEQLDALVDLLTNYPRYVAEQAKITPLVEQAQARSGAAAPGASP